MNKLAFLVEDDIQSFSIMDKLLKSYGFTTHLDWISSPHEDILAKIHELPPDLVLLNWASGIEFWDVCENSGADEKTKDIPILNFINPSDYKIDAIPSIVITTPVDIRKFANLLKQLA